MSESRLRLLGGARRGQLEQTCATPVKAIRYLTGGWTSRIPAAVTTAMLILFHTDYVFTIALLQDYSIEFTCSRLSRESRKRLE
jgi:hypothetical protein